MKVVALAGGVGGAKLADGLRLALEARQLTVVVNTGDDFHHFNLKVCPDLDTVCYTLSNLANPGTGWGRANETWSAMETLEMLGAPTWFHLGDRDLGWHLERTRRLKEGQSISQITADFCRILGINSTVLPMSDDPVPTRVITSYGLMTFQEYFVKNQCQPTVRGFQFEGVEHASPAQGVLDAIRSADLIVICPSNPWVSIDPILAIHGIKNEVAKRNVIAVSPIIAGKTLKGPAAKMFAELGIKPSSFAVSKHYSGLLGGMMIDNQDAELKGDIEALWIKVAVEDIVMNDREDRRRLAIKLLEFSKITTRKKE